MYIILCVYIIRSMNICVSVKETMQKRSIYPRLSIVSINQFVSIYSTIFDNKFDISV